MIKRAKPILCTLVCIVLLALVGCSGSPSVEQGGTVDIRTDESGNQIGYCVFSDGTEIEEWAYYRGEAEPAVPAE